MTTSKTPVKLSRRGWAAAAAGLALAGIGSALAWRTAQRQAQALSAAEHQFWQQQFTQPDGRPLATASLQGKPLVLNFWATWCPPCIEELPLLNAFYNENNTNGWQVLGLAVDQITPVNRFLAQTPLAFPVALAGFPGIEVSKSLGNLSGSLPFTVVFNPAGQVVHRKMGRLNPTDIQAWTKISA